MQINTNNPQQFTGTFIFKPKNIQTQDSIQNIVKKGKQIFYDIKDKGDVVIVTKDKYDKKVRDFIESENLDFTYFPEISTKSGLDDEIPSKLKFLLNIKDNCIVKNLKILNKFLSNNELHLNKQCEYLHDAINTLRLNVENAKIKIEDNGIFVIRDEEKCRTIKSTGFRGGVAYVHIIPDSVNEGAKRFLVGKNGKEIIKEYNTPKEILSFYKTFKKVTDAN